MSPAHIPLGDFVRFDLLFPVVCCAKAFLQVSETAGFPDGSGVVLVKSCRSQCRRHKGLLDDSYRLDDPQRLGVGRFQF